MVFRLCFVHNQVNARLHKPEFDCANLDATYDCGCGDEPINKVNVPAPKADFVGELTKDEITGVGAVKGGR
jgi:FAD-linked sulfhydryl oxidase